MRSIRAAMLAVVVISLAACSKPASTSPTDPVNQVITTATYAPALNVDLKTSTMTPSGLYYKDLTVGTGPVATAGQRVSANYDGWTVDGKEFDSSGSRGPYPFVLGAHAVIAGWDEGVAGMHVGGKRQLIVPASLGYGPSGNGPIPPNAILVFTVELVSVQ